MYTPEQTVAIIKFMNAHGADRVIPYSRGRHDSYAAGRFELWAWLDGTTIHYKDGNKHLDDGPAVFGWGPEHDGWFRNGVQIEQPTPGKVT